MWTERAIKVAEALRVLGWKSIVKNDEDVVWVYTNAPEYAPWRNDCKWHGMGRDTMLCLVMDMHYDPTTDTYLDDKLWEDVGHTPMKLEEITNK